MKKIILATFLVATGIGHATAQARVIVRRPVRRVVVAPARPVIVRPAVTVVRPVARRRVVVVHR